ncbi:MAG: type VI secretion IcmF C-terminal domain-containing protein, partial [Longimicrobiales bacterium]
PVAADVQRLLLAPVQSIEALLLALGPAEVNAGGATFCQRFSPLTSLYPFDSASGNDATVSQVSQMLQPESGALWSFYDQQLQGLLVQQGNAYAAAISAEHRPTSGFVAFFNKAAEVSRALYTQEGSGPEVVFELRPQASARIPEIRIEIDGQSQVVSRTMQATRPIEWHADRARSARIVATVDGAQRTVASAEGVWAVFKLFQQAVDTQRLGSGQYRVTWRVPGTDATLTAQLSFYEQIPIFIPGYLDDLDCVARIVAR